MPEKHLETNLIDAKILGPRIQAAKDLVREHCGDVEILLDENGEIIGKSKRQRYSRKEDDERKKFWKKPRAPRVFKLNLPSTKR